MNNEALLYVSKCLFSASESIREALDEIDLKSLDLGNYTAFLDTSYRLLEGMAKDIQKQAQS